ncbi:TIGR00730 family Rossman fold protein [Consotaella aegiceratis]|uniref:LOG family protein n=1 Tax=Consotaella aegiceratis TaxID=3097961 RepID=UPI002F3E21FF
MQRLCVFCGSSFGVDSAYLSVAQALGRLLVEEGIELVYGGGSVGLMGGIADAVLEAGGRVTGVIPQALFDKEVGHRNLTDLRIVGSMHERKALMAELSDGFVAMPGGIGTFEELFEVWTWAQLGYHAKPCSLLNVNGYYDGLSGFLDNVAASQFMKPIHRDMLIVEDEPKALLDRLKSYQPPAVSKWIGRDER